ncbi:hypothetical protein EV421DRAFT_1906527 [Armillaria borealis]|uniref:Uncharacterized protein n=1 Tax=Armillaria borealis TaxID=47425 RepID=A0AA39MLT6_9AGAR|nr:hypothetical protein EV421DRAFT_1906527 [Armillaria borealis]
MFSKCELPLSLSRTRTHIATKPLCSGLSLTCFLICRNGTRLPLSADTPTGVSSTRLLDARAVEPTLEFSGSTWIWTGEQNGAANDDAPAGVRPFREAIPSSSTKCPVCTTIIMSCDDSYSIVVSGKEIGAGNGYHTSAIYTVGLEPESHNVFAIAVNNTGGAAGLIAAIRVDYSDGITQTIVTDTTWKTIKATPPGGWTSPSFNDSDWMAASSERPTENTPWGMPALPSAMSMTGVSWIRTNEASAAGVDPLGHRPFLVISADDEYTLYVNDNNIGAMNLIAVDSVNTKPNVAGLIAGVLVAYNDGTTETLYTDDSWKTLATTSPAGFEATDLDDGQLAYDFKTICEKSVLHKLLDNSGYGFYWELAWTLERLLVEVLRRENHFALSKHKDVAYFITQSFRSLTIFP